MEPIISYNGLEKSCVSNYNFLIFVFCWATNVFAIGTLIFCFFNCWKSKCANLYEVLEWCKMFYYSVSVENVSVAADYNRLASEVKREEEKNVNELSFFFSFPKPTTAVLGSGTAWVSFPSPNVLMVCKPPLLLHWPVSNGREVRFGAQHAKPAPRLIWANLMSPCYFSVTHQLVLWQ